MTHARDETAHTRRRDDRDDRDGQDDEGGEGRGPFRWRQGLFRGGGSAAVAPADVPGWHERHWTSRALHRVGSLVAHSAAGVAAAVVMTVWFIVGLSAGFADWWETVLYSSTAAVTLVMVFVIQHTQTRQTSAIQRKLDELLRTSDRADDELISVEEAPDEDLQARADLDLEERRQATDP
jgi:low affinity Fe/Cu permease